MHGRSRPALIKSKSNSDRAQQAQCHRPKPSGLLADARLGEDAVHTRLRRGVVRWAHGGVHLRGKGLRAGVGDQRAEDGRDVLELARHVQERRHGR
jgi:hypothetical protein